MSDQTAMLDLDQMERRAKNGPPVVRNGEPASGQMSFPTPANVLADYVLVLVARVRELEAELRNDKAWEWGKREGVAAERKRCAEVVQSMCEHHGEHVIGDHIAAAIERGEE